MLPIRDHNPSGRTPYVTYVLMAANIGIFLSYFGMMDDIRAMNSFYMDWGMVPARLTDGGGFHTIISSMFLHGGFLHLAGNMLFLWIFGDNVEDELGHFNFLGFYLICGVLAALAHYALGPNSQVPTVGASGAIAGVMGGYFLLFPKAKVDILIILIVFFKILPIPAWIMLAVWFGMQFIGGISSNADEAGVAYWAHAGGFVAGILLLLPLWLARGGPMFWERTDGHPPHPEARYRLVESRIPKIPRR
ncbi:MAG: rhomboid family intramembrane serine protease [Roseobacter sp.]|nr:rhomboid family intramembrane serine protease [Roseobacter sp.]